MPAEKKRTLDLDEVNELGASGLKALAEWMVSEETGMESGDGDVFEEAVERQLEQLKEQQAKGLLSFDEGSSSWRYKK